MKKYNILKKAILLPNGKEIGLEKIKDKGLKIGSGTDACDIVLEGEYVASKHAVISRSIAGGLEIMALNEGYPVLLNGKPITTDELYALADADTISIAKHDLAIADHDHSLKSMGKRIKFWAVVCISFIVLLIINDSHYTTIYNTSIANCDKEMNEPTSINMKYVSGQLKEATKVGPMVIFFWWLNSDSLKNQYAKCTDVFLKDAIKRRFDLSNPVIRDESVDKKAEIIANEYQAMFDRKLDDERIEKIKTLAEVVRTVKEYTEKKDIESANAHIEHLKTLDYAQFITSLIAEFEIQVNYLAQSTESFYVMPVSNNSF